MSRKNTSRHGNQTKHAALAKGGELVAEGSDFLIGNVAPTLSGVQSLEGEVVMRHLADLIVDYVVAEERDPLRVAELRDQILTLGPLIRIQCPELPTITFAELS